MSTIHVFSYNLRCDVREDGINAFSNRKEFVLSEFSKYGADIVGFQETLPHMRQWLIDNFTDYQVCGIGREADLQGESNVVMFKKDKFDLVGLETFWLSDTPSVPGSRFSTDQSICPRICTCVTLYHRETGKSLRHYNTHLDHVGAFAQAQGISLILNRIASDYAKSRLPVILTGDFNATPDSVVRRSVLNFSGCGDTLKDVTENVGITFHGYNAEKYGCKIDYIFTNIPCDKERSFTARNEQNGMYLSDHYPVGAFLEI